MTAPRIIPAGPMGLDDILPMIREVGSLRERGEYGIAAELEERIRQPITVAGRALVACENGPHWQWVTCDGRASVTLYAWGNQWQAHVSQRGEFNTAVAISASGFGPTIAAALADAQKRYQAAIADTLLRMGGLLREVVS